MDLAALIVALVALGLAAYFFMMSQEQANRIDETSRTVDGTVKKLEGIFNVIYSDLFALLRDNLDRLAGAPVPETEGVKEAASRVPKQNEVDRERSQGKEISLGEIPLTSEEELLLEYLRGLDERDRPLTAGELLSKAGEFGLSDIVGNIFSLVNKGYVYAPGGIDINSTLTTDAKRARELEQLEPEREAAIRDAIARDLAES